MLLNKVVLANKTIVPEISRDNAEILLIVLWITHDGNFHDKNTRRISPDVYNVLPSWCKLHFARRVPFSEVLKSFLSLQ